MATARKYDWLKGNPPPHDITPFERFIRNHNWKDTPFGPIETWSPLFCHTVRSMMADDRPVVMMWGVDEYYMIYNEPYTVLVGSMHPPLLGSPPQPYFGDTWPYYHDVILKIRATGRAISGGALMVPLRRHGYHEETYFDWQFAPVFGEDGTIHGIYDTAFETTTERLAERRLSTTIQISEQISSARSVASLWPGLLKGLEYNPMDIPMAMIYSLREEKSGGKKICVLEGALGIPDGHAAIPSKIDYLHGNEGFASLFRLSGEGTEPLHLARGDARLNASLLEGLSWRGHGLPSTEFAVSPIRTGRSEELVAFMMLGLNPMRANDGPYRHFVQSIATQIVMPRISAILVEEEVQNGKIAAAKAQADRERLSRELQVKTRAHEQAESKFALFADTSFVALCIVNEDGSLEYANDSWYSLHGKDLDYSTGQAWRGSYHPDDLPIALAAFETLTVKLEAVTYQARMNKPWISPPDVNGYCETTPTWILCNAYPNLNSDGSLNTIFGAMTDISAQKYQEAQIIATTDRVLEKETKWSRFVNKAPVGICHLDVNGFVVTANEAWYKLMGYEQDHPMEPISWKSLYYEDEQSKIDKAWDGLFDSKAALVLEMQLKKLWKPNLTTENSEELNDFRTWTLNSAYVEADEANLPQYVIVCIMDITNSKYAEFLQKRRMEDALEVKRQQESFIDMTSHEMRNPLSAMQFSAEEIMTSIHELLAGKGDIIPQQAVVPQLSNGKTGSQEPTGLKAILESCVDAAQTIAYCTQHQKRIVDDILVMSRLDSNLLLITPVPVQPTELVRNGLQVFGGELSSVDVKLDYSIEPSMRELSIDWVMLDPSRILQVLINFVTNSIKFTRAEAKRKIQVRVGASTDRPKAFIEGFHFIPSRNERDDITLGSDWGTGEVVWLYFMVQDTGRGLNEEEKKLLFMRFSQSSPRTHVKYGGSGLGLFISRQLTEMQGGEIGVASDAGKGSTFAFYVKSRRTAPPGPGSGSLVEMLPSTKQEYRNGELGTHSIHRSEKVIPSASVIAVPDFTPSEIYILVVEDNLVNQKVLQKQLRSRGFHVDVANHGEEALDYLHQTELYQGGDSSSGSSSGSNKGSDASKLSVILMDWEMPVMDGIDCVKAIRKMEAAGTLRGKIPVIGVTANVRAEHIATAMKAGMDAVTTKPFQIGQIMTQIEQVLREKNATSGA